MVNIFPKNKNGWVKVLEVFFSIMLIMGVIIFLLNKGYTPDEISEEMSEMEISILRSIQLNDSMREVILGADVPSNWSAFSSGDLLEVKNKIENEKISAFDCEARICSLEETCLNEISGDKNVYSESAVISADSNTYNPRQIKLFCWEK